MKLQKASQVWFIIPAAMAGPLSTTKGTERKSQFHKRMMKVKLWLNNAEICQDYKHREPQLIDLKASLTNMVDDE